MQLNNNSNSFIILKGKVFRRISTGEVLTSHIGVGSEDDVNDFEEIEAKKDNQ